MSTTIPRGNVARMFCLSGSLNPGAVGAATSAEQNVPVVGVRVGDFVIAEKPTLDTGLMVGSCRVSATDNIKVNLMNCTGSTINAPDEVWRFLVFRPENPNSLSSSMP
jgi:hypothetical protein